MCLFLITKSNLEKIQKYWTYIIYYNSIDYQKVKMLSVLSKKFVTTSFMEFRPNYLQKRENNNMIGFPEVESFELPGIVFNIIT